MYLMRRRGKKGRCDGKGLGRFSSASRGKGLIEMRREADDKILAE